MNDVKGRRFGGEIVLRAKAFGDEVMEGTMAQSEAGRSPAERGVGIVVLIIGTL